jgi:hypothetical protein
MLDLVTAEKSSYRSGLQHRLFLNRIDVRPDTYVDNCTVHMEYKDGVCVQKRGNSWVLYIRSTDVYCTVQYKYILRPRPKVPRGGG